MEKVTKFFDWIYWLFMTICKLCFIGMVGITAFVVFNRYIIKGSLVWGEPVVLMFMVYMSLISAALAIRKDTHIRMAVIDMIVPPNVVCVMRAVSQVFIFLFGVFLIVFGWKFSMLAKRNVITGVGITSMWLYLSCPVAGIAFCLMEIERFINFWVRIKHGERLGDRSIADEAKELVKDAEDQNIQNEFFSVGGTK
ncbi:TRAP transporter small permease [uncultured Sphaerochaeta sp.]|uniref:TRAP transporter small permease n=1 Tax=uncultured Sphaerochaeta sp. TaxID=886478 RepID=UPI002A0A6646|nr:TRAP transporter small permease [uncultured Sphaerochaeta sp.]